MIYDSQEMIYDSKKWYMSAKKNDVWRQQMQKWIPKHLILDAFKKKWSQKCDFGPQEIIDGAKQIIYDCQKKFRLAYAKVLATNARTAKDNWRADQNFPY